MPILQCGGARCDSEYQDKTYGRGMRVFNQAVNANRELETLRCTVCKNEVTRSRKTPLADKKGKGGKVDKPDAKVVNQDGKVDKPAGKTKK